MESFQGNVVIVTGAASGIGAALAEALVHAKAHHVIIADLNLEAATALALRLGSTSSAVFLDVCDAKAVKCLIEHVVADHGRLDVMINNAGIGLTGEVRDLTLDHWMKILDVNLRGVIHGVTAAYPVMIAQGHGHIVNMASIAGLSPSVFSVPYATSKHAVVGLSTSLRAEAAGLGVRVSVACPGLIETPLVRHGPAVGISPQAAFEVLNVPTMLANVCALRILEGVARNRALILVTWQAKVAWWMARYMPGLTQRLSRDMAGKLRALRKPPVLPEPPL